MTEKVVTVQDKCMLHKNTWGVKKCGANQKQYCKQTGATKAYFHKYDWLCHLATFFNSLYEKGGQVTKPIIHTCENML